MRRGAELGNRFRPSSFVAALIGNKNPENKNNG